MSGLKIARGLELDPDIIGGWTLGVLAKKGAGKSYTARVLAEEFHQAGVPFVAIDPMGAMTGLRSSADGRSDGLPIVIFGGEHGDVPLEPTAGAVLADLVADEHVSMVLDLSAFGQRSLERQFARAFFDRLYRRNRELVHLLVDEADLFAPQKPQAGDQQLLGVMENIVRRGRNKGIGCTLISQRPAVLNKDVLTQIDLLVALRITSPQDRKAIGEWVRGHDDGDRGTEMLASLAGLANGESWWWAPELDLFKRVQVRQARTFDSSPTRTRGGRRVQPKRMADVDLQAVRERMAATIERAKADDPKLLRKQLATAQRQVRDLEARQPETAPAPDPVEVPVVSDDQLARLDRFAEGLSDTALRLAAEVSDLRAAAESVTDAVTLVRRARDTPPRAPRPAAPRLQRGPASTPRLAATPPAVLDGDFRPTGSQQRVLDTLAWFEMLGIPAPSRAALAPMAGSRPTSGGFKNNLGALRTAGLLDYPEGGRVQLTDPGRQIAEPPDTPTTAEALQDAVMASVTGAQARLLDTLIHAYPDPLSRDDLADQVQVPVTSGGFKNNLGALRTLELIDYPAAGQVVALPVLFPTGAHA